jgi:hypothetical protein
MLSPKFRPVTLCLMLGYLGDAYNGVQFQKEAHVLAV